jgi:DNA-binding NtrC family response regulator
MLARAPRILLIADDRYALRLLCRALGDSCELSFACDSREALARIESQQPFEIILSRLRGRGSLDVLRAVKKGSSDAEVIVLTDDEDGDVAEAAYALGAYQCLAALDPESIVHVVAHAFERGTLRAEVARLRREAGQHIGPES